MLRCQNDIKEVIVTAESIFYEGITLIVSDLSKDLPSQQRYERLLMAMHNIFPFDAAALLQLETDTLRPLAIYGLSDDTFGRRFSVTEHPRLQTVLNAREPIRFAADSPLPDPYDGLVDVSSADFHVHDCMGVSLNIDGMPWGVLTLDALEPGTFDKIDMTKLRTFISLTEATVKAAERIRALTDLNKQQQLVNQTLVSDNSKFEIIGNSAVMQQLKSEIAIVAQSHLTVLVEGETGVGKELVARQIHTSSSLAKGPLVYVNCAALPESIAESELFGHVKGAFTGAVNDRTGKFEIANGGTLFLDEIGELPLLIQAKLLRALQSGEIQRVGSDKFIQSNVRIVAATNRDLQHEVAEGRFRTDLYHRLSVYPIKVPALRERDRDILQLAGYFMEINQKRLGVQGIRLADNVKNTLLNYSWPGNVRELEHVLSRAALKAIADQGRTQRSVELQLQYFDISQAQQMFTDKQSADEFGAMNSTYMSAPNTATIDSANNVFILPNEVNSLKSAIDDFQTELIQQVINNNRGNLAKAGRELGVNRSNFYRLLRRLGIYSEEL
jgi:anaerobic nitric oxide reductase transcription regulator